MPGTKQNLVTKLNDVGKVLSFCPFERKLFDIFEGLYLYLKDRSEEILPKYQLQYLMLKCIHYPNAKNYSDIANYYLKTEENRFLSFLSDLAVLRLDPTSQESYDRAAAFAKSLFGGKKSHRERVSATNTCGISVIMPTYNRSGTIKESINSVLEQEYTDFELVVINDGGDNRVESVIRRIEDSRIKYVKISHSGLPAALNAGLQEARGEYISYLDDDDIYYPDHLLALIEVAKKQNQDFVYSKSKVVHGYRSEMDSFVPVKEAGTHTLPYSKTTLAMRLGISILNVLHRRELLNQVGFFNSDLPWSMDWDYWMRMSDVEKPYFIDKWTSEYRKTLNSMTIENWYQGIFYMHHLLVPYFCTAYGALTLYKTACLLEKTEKDIWAEKLYSYFISQDEMLKTVLTKKIIASNIGVLPKVLFRNKYRHEYSILKLVIKISHKILSKLKFR